MAVLARGAIRRCTIGHRWFVYDWGGQLKIRNANRRRWVIGSRGAPRWA